MASGIDFPADADNALSDPLDEPNSV